MSSPKIIIAIVSTLLLAHWAHGYCIPCPQENLSIASFTECNCSLTLFGLKDKCVEFSECPKITYQNPIPELEALMPYMKDAFDNLMKLLNNPLDSKKTNDINLTVKAVNKYVDDVKQNLKKLIAPIIGTLAINNKDLLEECKGDTWCMFSKALLRKETYEMLIPSINPIFKTVMDSYLSVVNDMQSMTNNSCANEDECPMAKALMALKNYLPPGFDTLLDIKKIREHLPVYFEQNTKSD